MNQALFYLAIILSFCFVFGVADYISDTTDTSDSTDTLYPTDPSGGTFTYCGGNDWFDYEDEKCFKLIKKFATRDEAETFCNQEYLRTDSVAPTLVSIKSAAEQEHLTKFVFNSPDSNSVWIGLRRRPENGNQFVWNDGSVISGSDFDNWPEGSPTEQTERGCMEMQSEFSKQFSNMSDLDQRVINGDWKDVRCNKPNWVLCQKLQTWTLQHLQKTFLHSRKELQDSLKDVTNQLSDTINQLDNTKNELTTTKNDLITTNTVLTTTNIELATTKTDLTNTKTDLTNTKTDLADTKTDLANTKTDLANTKTDLANTKTDLANTKTDLASTKTDLTNTKTDLANIKNELGNVQKNPIPIGFIYIQLPGQPEPWDLWGSVEWIEITSQYAGLFFRVLGGDSAHFGVEQEGNSPRLVGANYIKQRGQSLYNINILSNNEWSSPVESGSDGTNNGNFIHLSFKVSNGEVRPRNKAMRIWKRI